MRVLIADDNELVRRGIASLLSGENELEVCGEASDAIETLKKAEELRPGVILLDVSMPGRWSVRGKPTCCSPALSRRRQLTRIRTAGHGQKPLISQSVISKVLPPDLA
jgi:DNA-binding NarL/FixJ family response regulator